MPTTGPPGKAERASVALNLAGDGIGKDAVGRGDMLLERRPTPGRPHRRRASGAGRRAEPIGQWTSVRLHHAAAEVGARLVLLADDPVLPGAETLVQLVLERPIAAAVGDRYILRDPSARRTIGGGRFLDLPGRAQAPHPERLGQLAAQAIEEPGLALASLLSRPPYVVDFTVFARDRGLTEAEAEAAAADTVRIVVPAAVIALAQPVAARLEQSLLAALAAFHDDNPDLPGIGVERLRLRLEPRLPAPAFAALLRKLAQAQAVALDGAWVRLPGHAVRLTAADERSWASIQPLLSGAGRFRPPRVRDLADCSALPEADVRRLLKLVGRIGKVDEVAHDHFFLRQTVAKWPRSPSTLPPRRRTGSSPPHNSATGSTTAARSPSRCSNSSTVTASPCGAATCAASTSIGSTCSCRPQPRSNRLLHGRESSPVGRPDFKSGRGREPVSGGFDPHSLPPTLTEGDDATNSSLSRGAAGRG